METFQSLNPAAFFRSREDAASEAQVGRWTLVEQWPADNGFVPLTQTHKTLLPHYIKMKVTLLKPRIKQKQLKVMISS